MKTAARILFVLMILSTWALPSAERPRQRIALLIGSPWKGEETMIQNDLGSMRRALLKRGFDAGQIKELSGSLNRLAVLTAVRSAAAATATWGTGEFFFYYSGHGRFSGETAETAKPSLALGPEVEVSWEEVFSTLHLPQGVRLIVLPDC
jgi:hypothetical protein